MQIATGPRVTIAEYLGGNVAGDLNFEVRGRLRLSESPNHWRHGHSYPKMTNSNADGIDDLSSPLLVDRVGLSRHEWQDRPRNLEFIPHPDFPLAPSWIEASYILSPVIYGDLITLGS